MSEPTVRLNVDTTGAEAKIDMVEAEAFRVRGEIGRTVNRMVQMGTLALHFMTGLVDESFRVLAMLVSQSIRTILAISATGFTTVNIGRIAQVGLLILQYQQIQQGHSAASARLSSAREFLNYQVGF